ncbi:MAG: endolytic transglycosylase MltG [Candidatus Levybacteria bacterium]|nr:endolytic transglycosylase MltG [Candidatus Levybacteria bacterium]
MKRLLILIIVILLFVGFGVVWWKMGTMPADPNNNAPQIFVIERGAGMRQISNELKSKGLIRDPIVFFLLTKRLGLDTKIQAGDFRLNPSMSAFDIAQSLTHGTLDIWVTVPEGHRAAEIADLLEKYIPTYETSWKTALGAKEGYLFPDTYLIPREASVDQIITLMTNNFDSKYTDLQSKQSTNRTENEIVTIASLVEREAKFDRDRPLVASVIYNRLSEGMALQIDATVQYILGYQQSEKSWWKKNLTFDDLKISSSYNTYVNAGLPPGPIANPGSAAIKAALNPAKTNYLYYISDKNSVNHYARTLEEHNQNKEKYIK